MNPKVVIAAVIVLLLAAGGAYYFLYHNGSDAVSTGSAEKPLDSLDIGADDGALRAFYVKVGGEVSVKNYEDDDVTVTVESAQGAGISVSDKGASGTAAEKGQECGEHRYDHLYHNLPETILHTLHSF